MNIKSILLVLVLFHSQKKLLGSDLWSCFRPKNAKVVPIDLPVAREHIVLACGLSDLIDSCLRGNEALVSLQKRNVNLVCEETKTHRRDCVCCGTGEVTIGQIFQRNIFEYLGIMEFPDGDEHLAGYIRGDMKMYSMSRATPYVMFFIASLKKRYQGVIFHEKKRLKENRCRQKREEKRFDRLKRRFETHGMVTLMCRCQAKFHRSCFESVMSGQKHRKNKCCDLCHDDVTDVLEESALNFGFPVPGRDRCSMCRKLFIRAKKNGAKAKKNR